MDFQNGSLAVEGGREIASAINMLLDLPFILKVATKDFHPGDHISFSGSHDPPNNKAFESIVEVINPFQADQKRKIPIWPAHCVQGTGGAQLIPEIDLPKFHVIVEKGRDSDAEMFSAFADVFGNKVASAVSEDLATLLKDQQISHVFVAGLAGDFCVKWCALDAQKEGFTVCVIEDATRSVDEGEHGWMAAKRQLENAHVNIVFTSGPEVAKVKGHYS